MTPELTTLTLAALLQVIQFALFAIPANVELGTVKTLSPRDKDRMPTPLVDQVSTKTARLLRAYNNHIESLILFAIACVVITISGQSTPITATCAWIYVTARAAYIPAYYFGWVPWRSFIWFASFVAITIMLLAAFL